MVTLFLKKITFQFNLVLLLILIAVNGYASTNMVIVIIDGARYSETFGHPTHVYIPYMHNLAWQGTVLDNFRNDSLTYTSRAIPALWCGTWTGVRDTVYNGSNTQYSLKPSIFEYFRKQKAVPATDCFYVLKYISSLWLPSFNADYGPDYWPQYHSVGSSDADVIIQAKSVLSMYHPVFTWIYLADVDGAGHSGNWTLYTRAITIADSLVGVLWNFLQNDQFYQNTTTLFVTNDHGRHDDQHGGFSGHGDGCEGCRHIMFLALGPDIKSNYVSHQSRRIPDLAVTAGHMMGLNLGHSSGEIMSEILATNLLQDVSESVPTFKLAGNYPNPFNNYTRIIYSLNAYSHVLAEIYNLAGEKILTILDEKQIPGTKFLVWSGKNDLRQEVTSGIYFIRMQAGSHVGYHKIILIK
ncbi:MAG: T9SS C-terminal target domain-containing protein [Calditrichaeota bacterium]|nr:MAG: T9SS C-terminal target domain-containing protein [Calditrichota bacterium]